MNSSHSKTIRSQNDSGAALISAIFSILLAVVIGGALQQATVISLKIATNERDNTEAFYIADAGLNHALKLLAKVPATQFSSVLTNGTNSTPNSGDELSEPPIDGLWTTAENIPGGDPTTGGVTGFGAGGTGRYWVSIRNDAVSGESASVDANRTLIVTSTGVGRNGATTTVEATYAVPISREPAIVVNGKAVVVGVPIIRGINGIIHTNDSMTIIGVTCTEQYLSSSREIFILLPSLLHKNGSGCSSSGVRREFQDNIPVPVHDIPTEFKGQADFILGATGSRAGRVYDRLGNQIGNNSWSNGEALWLWDALPKTWTMVSVLAQPNGVYYSEGNIILAGVTATALLPARATLIAEGSIHVVGATNITPVIDNYSLIAGNDLLIAGLLGSPGTYYARDQFDIIGVTSVNGSIRAANYSDGPAPGGLNLVLRILGALNLTGVFVLTDDGFKTGAGVVSGWHEVRN